MSFSAAQAIIAAMITPALLILASASLIATALVRLARAVDRARVLIAAGEAATAPGALRAHADRAMLAERAVTLYFSAIVCFVVAGFAIAIDHFTGSRVPILPVGVTSLGMCLIVAGSAAMLAECRIASAQIRSEILAVVSGAARTTRVPI